MVFVLCVLFSPYLTLFFNNRGKVLLPLTSIFIFPHSAKVYNTIYLFYSIKFSVLFSLSLTLFLIIGANYYHLLPLFLCSFNLQRFTRQSVIFCLWFTRQSKIFAYYFSLISTFFNPIFNNMGELFPSFYFHTFCKGLEDNRCFFPLFQFYFHLL